ncbi:PRC-barrel domain-containing protein [Bartonella tamiae]|uniref:PRC-barrel domain-containing protein n=1 Tax=Bartonella tamiae Th239 TaxID=1094558 RepID=J0QTH2_9HYPH|nr:PRC-barrel domain-containing protein [Bartonella tamiae]EJF89201.1 hypothetical protein ME5_01752 [Bartonella tamiae Th239]EJF95396.1 hypothetical protein MEG_00129 [Bartonella tamiae Th307]
MKKIALIAMMTTACAGVAFAQAPTAPTTPSTAYSTAQTDHATNDMAALYVTPTKTDFVASSLINTKVLNLQDETIGEIKDVVIQKNEIEGIVIGVGGFLGVGERYVVVDPSTIRMTNDNGSWKVITNATKASLESAPEFKYEGRWDL